MPLNALFGFGQDTALGHVLGRGAAIRGRCFAVYSASPDFGREIVEWPNLGLCSKRNPIPIGSVFQLVSRYRWHGGRAEYKFASTMGIVLPAA